MTLTEKNETKKLNRSLALNGKASVIAARATASAGDSFNRKFLDGDTDSPVNIGVNDLIWYYYKEKNLESGTYYTKPRVRYLSDSLPVWRNDWQTIVSNAIASNGDGLTGLFPPDENGASASFMNMGTSYLNTNGITAYTTNGLLGNLATLATAIGDTATTTAQFLSGYTYVNASLATKYGDSWLYGDTYNHSGIPYRRDRTGYGIRGRRSANIGITTASSTTFRFQIGANPAVLSEPRFYSDAADTNGFNSGLKTALLNAFTTFLTNGDSNSYYQTHLRDLRDKLGRIHGRNGDTNLLWCSPWGPNMRNELLGCEGDSYWTIQNYLTTLSTIIGNRADTWGITTGDTTIWGYYNYFYYNSINLGGGDSKMNTRALQKVKSMLYLPDGQGGIKSHILNRYYAIDEESSTLNRVDRGNCESATSPALTPGTSAVAGNSAWTRVSTQAYTGTYSYRLTKNVAAGAEAFVAIGTDATGGLNALTPGKTYTFDAWVYIPSVGGVTGTDVWLIIYDRLGAGDYQANIAAATNTYDQWQHIYVTRTTRVGCLDIFCRIRINTTADSGKLIYVDDISVKPKTILGNSWALPLTKLRNWRHFWLNERIGKPVASYSSYNGLSYAIASATVQVTNAETTLKALFGDDVAAHSQFIPTPKSLASFNNPVYNRQTGVITQYKTGFAFDGQQHATHYKIYRQSGATIGSAVANTQWAESTYYDITSTVNAITGLVDNIYTDDNVALTTGQKWVYRVRTADTTNKMGADTTYSLQSDIFDASTVKSFTVSADSQIFFGTTNTFKKGQYVVINNALNTKSGYYKITNLLSDTGIIVSPVIGTTTGSVNLCNSVVFV